MRKSARYANFWFGVKFPLKVKQNKRLISRASLRQPTAVGHPKQLPSIILHPAYRPYILVIKNFMTPYFSFQKFFDMTTSIFGTPFRRKCQPPYSDIFDSRACRLSNSQTSQNQRNAIVFFFSNITCNYNNILHLKK